MTTELAQLQRTTLMTELAQLERTPCSTELAELDSTALHTELANFVQRTLKSPPSSLELGTCHCAPLAKRGLRIPRWTKAVDCFVQRGGAKREASPSLTLHSVTLDKLELWQLPWLKTLSSFPKGKLAASA